MDEGDRLALAKVAIISVVADLDAASDQDPNCPLGISQTTWTSIPDDKKDEVKERYAYYLFRGEKPAAALHEAQATMALDAEDFSDPIDWPNVRRMSEAHAQPVRDPVTYRPKYSLLRDAYTVVDDVRAALEDPGAVRDPRAHFMNRGWSGKYLEAAVRSFGIMIEERSLAQGLTYQPTAALTLDETGEEDERYVGYDRLEPASWEADPDQWETEF